MLTTSEPKILRASGSTNSKKLASAISNELYVNESVAIRSIGVQAMNQTVKAIAIAGRYTGAKGFMIGVAIAFENIIGTQDKEISAIRFTCWKRTV